MPHFYERNIIEIKNEYTTFLINIMSPIVYKGIKSIYDHAVEKRQEIKKTIKEQLDQGLITDPPKIPSELRIFQIYLKDIPSWNKNIIEKETQRARVESRCPEFFDDLVKAVIKSNIVLLTFSATEKQCELVKQKIHENVDTKELIHKIYIECAKAVYNFPELLWHHYDSLEIKRNQRELLNIVKESIKEGIRQLLPMKMILEQFLKNDYIKDEDTIEEPMTETKFINMKNLVDKDLYSKNQYHEDNEDSENSEDVEEQRHSHHSHKSYSDNNSQKMREKISQIRQQIKTIQSDGSKKYSNRMYEGEGGDTSDNDNSSNSSNNEESESESEQESSDRRETKISNFDKYYKDDKQNKHSAKKEETTEDIKEDMKEVIKGVVKDIVEENEKTKETRLDSEPDHSVFFAKYME
jgi:hypothetical protein